MTSRPGTDGIGFTALIGGSFDPVHNGHLYLARELLKDPDILELAFVPVGRHHFKMDLSILSFDERVGLISRVLEPGMQLWEDDAQGSGFTADLIRRLSSKYPDKRFAFVIGSDNLSQLPRWHEYEWLKRNLTFIVIPRPGYELVFPQNPPLSLLVKSINPPDVSSSRIRQLVLQDSPIDGLVPERIREEIITLYSRGNKTHEK